MGHTKFRVRKYCAGMSGFSAVVMRTMKATSPSAQTTKELTTIHELHPAIEPSDRPSINVETDRDNVQLPIQSMRRNSARALAFSSSESRVRGKMAATTTMAMISSTHWNQNRARHPKAAMMGEPTDTQLQQLQEGIELDNGAAKVAAIEPGGRSGSNAWYHVTLRETRHRDLRPALAAVGLAVSRVIRVRYDTIALGDLYRGSSRPLTPAESRSLYSVAGLESRRPEAREAEASP